MYVGMRRRIDVDTATFSCVVARKLGEAIGVVANTNTNRSPGCIDNEWLVATGCPGGLRVGQVHLTVGKQSSVGAGNHECVVDNICSLPCCCSSTTQRHTPQDIDPTSVREAGKLVD